MATGFAQPQSPLSPDRRDRRGMFGFNPTSRFGPSRTSLAEERGTSPNAGRLEREREQAGRLGGESNRYGPSFLRRILEQFILPQAEQRTGERNELFSSFMQDFNAAPGSTVMPAVERATGAFTEELFGPEGPVSEAITGALRTGVQSGFGPRSGQVGALQGQIGREAGRSVGQFLGQRSLEGVGLETQRLQARGAFLSEQEQLLLSFLSSIFTGAANAEQLELATRGLIIQE